MSMPLSMYQASVPVFLRYLNQLDQLLDLAIAFSDQRGADPQSVLQARLSPTMYPFGAQVEIAANFALRACCPLAGLDVPPFGQHSERFLTLKARITEVTQLLAGIRPEQMEGSEARAYVDRAGNSNLTLQGPEFLLQYALPNFLFHLTTAYAILRHIGVAVGKSDFDGFHSYE